MAAYYTRAEACSEVELEDVEQGDFASVATTTPTPIIPVGLQVEFTGEFESMATEMAGPVATHSQLLPEGGHPSVGGHGIAGSASSPLVGVSTLRYPSELADPLDSAVASAADVLITADATSTASTTGTSGVISRQPPTTAEVTAAASRSPTISYILAQIISVFLCVTGMIWQNMVLTNFCYFHDNHLGR